MTKERRVHNIEEYLREISTIKAGWPTSALAFRGQENKDWLLESSAARRLKASSSSNDGISDQLFLEYHEALLKKCKLNNYDNRDGQKMDELEVLADLQHHGAATCLLDFTRGALIALWFACEKSETDGKVFVVNTADERSFSEITPTDIKDESIRNILEFKTRDSGESETDRVQIQGFWYWTPAHLNERITAQHSLFLFGLPSSGKSKLKAEEIVIESSKKEQMRRELKELHDIHEEALFPDFVGFAYTQRHNAPYETPDAQEYLRHGIEAQQRGQYSEAIENYTKALSLNQDNYWAYLFRGSAYFYKSEYDYTIHDLNAAIQLHPNEDWAHLLRGTAYFRLGKDDRALHDASTAIQLNPELSEAYHLRGGVYFRRGEPDRAIHALSIAIQLNPDLASAYSVRGSAYTQKGEYENAIHDLDTGIELNPNDYRVHLLRGTAYSHLGKDDQALHDASTAIQLNPDSHEAYYLRGGVYFRKGEYDHAVHDLDSAIALAPNFADAISLAKQVATTKANEERQQQMPLGVDDADEEAEE